ncbi:MAG: hypothetical protein J6C26_10835, partial [Clostridia bacterium]|nr:hypothetical protein [Clostridia bacterium]
SVEFGSGAFDDCSLDLTLYGYAGSTTEAYAAEYGFEFVAIEAPVPEFVTGDITGDGALDLSDAILLFQHTVLPDLYPVSYSESMDFNKDGNLDLADAILLFQHSMLPDLYPLA